MDAAFNVLKFKYIELDQLIGEFIKTNRIKTCNLFIDLDYINFRFRSASYNTRFQACGAAAFKQYASNILNLVAHYKKWFVRNGVNLKCYIYYTNAVGGFTSALINKNYRRDYLSAQDANNPKCYYINLCINGGIQLLGKICDYIDGVYLINTKGEEPAVLPYLISQTNKADWNYLLSQDRLELQYVNYDRFSIIYPSHSYGNKIITAANLWETICIKEGKFTPHYNEYDSKLFIPVMAIAGDKTRSISKIRTIGWIGILDILDEIWSTNKDHSLVTMLDAIMEILNNKNKKLEEKYMYNFKMNMLMCSMKSRYDVMSETNKTMILSQIKDIPDRETLNEIANNPMLFGNYPINVDALFNNSKYVNWNK